VALTIYLLVDNAGCVDSSVVVINESPALNILVLDSIQNISCFGETDGAVFLSGNGGLSPLSNIH
jgi:hypothetical protein